ncbi:hypothetical protein DFH09DRAFT_1103675 [Mycena vulgaris]|nr:hypothetical protein DFH09DRAFT_1103675 [Mycena vulgaris]
MPPRPSLEVLRKGLSLLKESVKTRKDGLMNCLRRKEKISASDEAWLDDAANHVDEDAVMNKLENASDYERGFARLDVKRPREATIMMVLRRSPTPRGRRPSKLLQHFSGTLRMRMGHSHVGWSLASQHLDVKRVRSARNTWFRLLLSTISMSNK